jgi:predicted GIY-YIG superfamily endonuclease
MTLSFFIYKIYQVINPSVFYIGSTVNFSARKSAHKKNCYNRTSKKYRYPIYQYIRACGGWDMFVMEIYKIYPYTTKKDVLIKEQEIMDLLEPTINAICSTKKFN